MMNETIEKKEDTIILVFDLETTGFSPSKDRILQLAYKIIKVKSDGSEVVLKTFCEYCNPDEPDEFYNQSSVKKALEVNGIDKGMFSLGNIEFSTPVGLIQNLIGDFDIYSVDNVIGQNILGYDYKMILGEIDRFNFTPNYSQDLKYWIGEMVSKTIDLKFLTGNMSLKNLCEKYGIAQNNAHDALDDVNCTYEAYKKIKEEKNKISSLEG